MRGRSEPRSFGTGDHGSARVMDFQSKTAHGPLLRAHGNCTVSSRVRAGYYSTSPFIRAEGRRLNVGFATQHHYSAQQRDGNHGWPALTRLVGSPRHLTSGLGQQPDFMREARSCTTLRNLLHTNAPVEDILRKGRLPVAFTYSCERPCHATLTAWASVVMAADTSSFPPKD